MANIIVQFPTRVAATFNLLSAAGTTEAVPTPSQPWAHTVIAVVTGAPATATVKLQGTIDGVNWADMNTAQNILTTPLFIVANMPVQQVRCVLTLTGGTSPTVSISYAGVA